MELIVWQRSLSYALLEQWKRPNRVRSAATIVVAQNILSTSDAGEDIQVGYPFKLKGGGGTREGSPDPSSQSDQAEGIPGGDAQGVGHCTQTPFLNQPLSLVVWGHKCGQGKD